MAQQTYLIGSGVAQGAANLVLAKGLANYPEISTDTLGFATFVSAVLTFIPVIIFLNILKQGATRRTA